jgi:translocation and assembly module TamB
VTFDVDGRFGIRGALGGQPLISGSATVERLDVNLAAALPPALSALEVTHRNAPPGLAVPTGAGGSTEGGGFDPRFALSLSAPGRVFVRGQGLTAELGGELQLAGTLRRPSTVGAFSLRRGELSLLGQRFELARAGLTFAGDSDPLLDIAAETSAGDVVAVFGISGRASRPQLTVGSRPELPADEVLARLLFSKATSELTPGEAVALAHAVTQLAGIGEGGGILEQIRQKTGLDQLSVTTDQDGQLVVDIGRHVGDRAYVGVEQGAAPGSTRATIDLDITELLKGRAEVGADGNARLGITIQREY